MSDLIGRELGPYRILAQIGVGGMAAVYKAYQAAMDRYVAVKVLPEQMALDVEVRQRFEQEARVIARLEHAHILPVHDYGQAQDRLYLVMRYIEAGTLKDRLEAGMISLAEVSRILRQVGGALEYAHRLGVVHRDVKPSNVLLDDQGDCYLTDFGLAKMMEASVRLTASGVGLGTPAYMSPEQGQGKKVDARSDVYSLGVMLYEMVTGRVPYEAETPVAVLLKHITAPLPLPRDVRPEVPRAVERVILKAMAKNPADRFQTVGEMVEAFDAAAGLAQAEMLGEIEVAAPEAMEPPARAAGGVQKWAQARWARAIMWVAAGAAALFTLLFALSHIPLKLQIREGQLEIVQFVQVTPTVAAVTRATATIAPPTATPTSHPAATATPATVPPTATAVPEPTFTPTRGPTPTALSGRADMFTPSAILDRGGSEVAWSPDGRLLAVGWDKVYFYDVETWAQTQAIDVDGWVGGLAFSPDGATLAAIAGQVRLYDVASGSELHVLPRTQINTSAASSQFLAFSSDGATLAVVVGDTAKLFEVASGREVGTIIVGGATAIAFSPDGQTLYAGGWQGLDEWEVASGQKVRSFGEGRVRANRLALSPDGSLLGTSGTGDDPIRLWEVATGRELGTLTGHTDTVNGLVFSPDGQLLASASSDVTVKLWEVVGKRELQTLVGHAKGVEGVVFSPDGAMLASVAHDGTARVWGVAP